jgi:hypothetical protein
MNKWIILILALVGFLGVAFPVLGVEGNLTISDREIIERLTRLEEGQKSLKQRFDDLRMELKGDIQDLRALLYVVLGGMIALIGFVIWDRRSALSPVITRTRELEGDRDRTLRALRDYAQGEPKLAEIMRNLGLM